MLFRQGNGPSSADDRDAVADVVKFYQSSPLMQRYVDVHVVFEDPVNGEDSTLYPVNFLRNVAIKHVKTSHVYYLDVDIVPSLSCRELAEHLAASLTDLQMSDSVSDCRKCAFATPVFTVSSCFPCDDVSLMVVSHSLKLRLTHCLGRPLL